MTMNFDFECHDHDSGVTYIPWTDGWAVGYKVVFPGTGKVEYFYLNPAGGSDMPNDPTIFVYQGTEGDPAQDGAQHHYLIRPST